MASFERYSSPSRSTSSLSETRWESWASAHSKNCSEQKLLKNRLKEIDRERARSLYNLNMERRSVKRDHNKLLVDRRLLVNSPHFGESSNSGTNAVQSISGRSKNECLQERVDCWKIEMAARCQSASPRLQLHAAKATEDIVDDQALPSKHQSSLGISLPKRPASTPIVGNMESLTSDRLREAVDQDVKQCDITEDCITTVTTCTSLTERASSLESKSLRLRARRAEIDRMVQSKISRLKTLSRVPADFNLRAKTSSVARSGQPQISLNFFHEHHQNGKARGQATVNRKTNENIR